jgi:hypothetical protein
MSAHSPSDAKARSGGCVLSLRLIFVPDSLLRPCIMYIVILKMYFEAPIWRCPYIWSVSSPYFSCMYCLTSFSALQIGFTYFVTLRDASWLLVTIRDAWWRFVTLRDSLWRFVTLRDASRRFVTLRDASRRFVTLWRQLDLIGLQRSCDDCLRKKSFCQNINTSSFLFSRVDIFITRCLENWDIFFSHLIPQ